MKSLVYSIPPSPLPPQEELDKVAGRGKSGLDGWKVPELHQNVILCSVKMSLNFVSSALVELFC